MGTKFLIVREGRGGYWKQNELYCDRMESEVLVWTQFSIEADTNRDDR